MHSSNLPESRRERLRRYAIAGTLVYIAFASFIALTLEILESLSRAR